MKNNLMLSFKEFNITFNTDTEAWEALVNGESLADKSLKKLKAKINKLLATEIAGNSRALFWSRYYGSSESAPEVTVTCLNPARKCAIIKLADGTRRQADFEHLLAVSPVNAALLADMVDRKKKIEALTAELGALEDKLERWKPEPKAEATAKPN